MKITNISIHKTDITLIAADNNKLPVEFTIKYGEFAFTPTNEKTRSINIHGAKKNIGISFDEEKPSNLDFFKSYSENILIPETSSLQDFMNFQVEESEKKQFLNKIKGEELFQKTKEVIGLNDNVVYSELNIEAIKESVDEYIKEQETNKPKKVVAKKTSKKGTGTPKKRGPKPKKRPPGRPKGSKNKKTNADKNI